jgi:hypothetical protein
MSWTEFGKPGRLSVSKDDLQKPIETLMRGIVIGIPTKAYHG